MILFRLLICLAGRAVWHVFCFTMLLCIFMMHILSLCRADRSAAGGDAELESNRYFIEEAR
jgi:hypothetical protein